MKVSIRHRLVTAVVCALIGMADHAASAAPIDGTPPYAQSTYITDMTIDWSTYWKDGQGSDNWPTTWSAGNRVFTSFGDGGGFGEDAEDLAYVSLGFAELFGNGATTLSGRNLIGGMNPTIAPCFPILSGMSPEKLKRPGHIFPCRKKAPVAKSRSVLALGDQLYAWLTPGSVINGYKEGRLFRSTIDRNDWVRANWALTRDSTYPLIFPTFVQAGQNHSAYSDFVYAYATRFSTDNGKNMSMQTGPNGGEITLLRAPFGSDLLNRSNWQFYAGMVGSSPQWSPNQGDAKGVFFDRNGVGWLMSASYLPEYGRYFIFTANTKARSGRVGIHEAPTPWGPWHTVFYNAVANPALGVPPNAFFFNHLANSSKPGGKWTLIFGGSYEIDAINAVDVTFQLSTTARKANSAFFANAARK